LYREGDEIILEAEEGAKFIFLTAYHPLRHNLPFFAKKKNLKKLFFGILKMVKKLKNG